MYDRIERAKERREVWRIVIIVVSTGALFGLGLNMANLLFSIVL